MEWCYLGSRGASGGILLLWDKRVVEKVEDCVWSLLSRVLFGVSVIILNEHSRACMVLVMTLTRKCFGMKWVEL